MKHTLAVVFETRAEASLAREELVHNGYDADSIRIDDSISMAGTAHLDDDASLLGTVKQMFSGLVGREHADRHVYAEVLNRGHTVLTVTTSTLEAAERAAVIVDDFNPPPATAASVADIQRTVQRSGMRIYPRRGDVAGQPGHSGRDR